MTQKSETYPPNARRILNEIMTIIFIPEAAIGESIPSEQVSASIGQFANADKSEVAIVKNLLSRLLDQVEKLEHQIELREVDEADRAFQSTLKAQEERLRTMRSLQAERLKIEARKNFQKWYVTDQQIILQKIKSKELLTLAEFLEIRGVSKRTISIAMAWGRIFCITAGSQEYYPAFFADSSDPARQNLGKVCQALANVPAFAKYQFLTTKSSCLLNSATPIQAIRLGRVDDVLRTIKWLLEP